MEWIESIKKGNVEVVKMHHKYSPRRGSEVTNETHDEFGKYVWKMGLENISIEAL